MSEAQFVLLESWFWLSFIPIESPGLILLLLTVGYLLDRRRVTFIVTACLTQVRAGSFLSTRLDLL